MAGNSPEAFVLTHKDEASYYTRGRAHMYTLKHSIWASGTPYDVYITASSTSKYVNLLIIDLRRGLTWQNQMDTPDVGIPIDRNSCTDRAFIANLARKVIADTWKTIDIYRGAMYINLQPGAQI